MDTVKRDIYISINGKEVVNSLSGLRKGMRETERDIRNLNRNDKDYTEQLAKHQQRLSQLKDEYAKARGEIAKTPGVLQRVKNELGEVGMGFIKAFTITALIGTFIAGIKSAFNVIVEFDQAQADLAGILGTTKSQIAGLTLEAIKLGAKLPFTSTEVSRAQLELAKLGKSMDEIKNMTPGVLNAAIAMDTDLAPAAELVAGQLNSYAESSSNAAKFADIMSNSTNISGTSFEYLSTAIPKTSKVAALANVSFEKLNATMGVLSDETISAETAGTGFRNILLSAAKQGVPYEKLLEKVRNSTNQLTAATTLFGKENATVAVILANSSEKLKEQTLALENSSGSAEALAKEKMNSIQGDLKLFDSAIEGFVLSIEKGDGILGQFTRTIVQMGTGLIGLITPTRNLSDELLDQQIAVNSLISRITSSNIENTERLRLLKELKDNYPSFIENIDIEKVSNEELVAQLKEVNSNYRERIRLQLEVEKADKAKELRDGITKEALQWEDKLIKKLTEISNKHEIDVVVDVNNVEKSAKEIMNILKENGERTGLFSDYHSIEKTLGFVTEYKKWEVQQNGVVEQQMQNINKLAKEKGIVTEDELKVQEQAKKNLDDMLEKAIKLGGISGTDFNSEDIDSIQKYIIAKQAQIELDSESAAAKKELSEKEKKQLESKQKAFEAGEKAIDDLLKQSIQNRELALLQGINKEIKSIEFKYEKEIEKIKNHTDRIAELEALRDQEINDIKLAKSKEYQDRILALEEESIIRKRENEIQRFANSIVDEDERALFMLNRTREIHEMELQLQMDNEIAKVENVENSEQLIAAIKDKYANKKEAIEINLAEKERQISENKLRREKDIENQKLNVIKGAFNSASELFNQGSSAWKATKIAETTIDTYQAGSRALAAFPPPFSYIAMAASIATGLKNVQKIVSTKVPEMPSYYYGGFTSPNTPNNLGGDSYGSFTGMTHANEWVMPAFMTQSARYADTLSWLESERRNGPTNNNPSYSANDALAQASLALASTALQLNETLSNGIRSNVNIGYKETMKINALQEEINQTQKNSSV